MGVRVVKVRRRERLGWLERSYLPRALRSLRIVARQLVHSARGGAAVTEPEARPDALRGMPVLVAQEDGSPLCVACGLCERACPARCIRVVACDLEDAAIERAPETFEIDMGRCMFCGLCEEACPEEAIVMSPFVELATQTRAELSRGIDRLLVPAAHVQRRIDFLRAGYERGEGA
jgi:NADH-quinone oxidoreductase subunit I